MGVAVTVLADLVVLALVARLLLSWLPVGRRGGWGSVQRAVVLATEPVVAPVRAVIRPVSVGGVALDVAPALVILALALLVAIVS